MKVICILPIFGRRSVTLTTLMWLKKQTHPFYKIIVVGSSNEDKTTAELANVEYIEYKNLPLSNKVQFGITTARKYSPDAILTTGSDSWLTLNLCKTFAKYIMKGNDLVGIRHSYSCKANPDEKLEILSHKYKIRKDPVGGGRMVSSRVLDIIKWKLFPSGLNKGLDHNSYNHLIKNVKDLKIKIIDNPSVFSMDIKSNTWENITPFNRIKRSNNLVVNSVEKPEKWIEKQFHGSLEMFKNMIPGIKI